MTVEEKLWQLVQRLTDKTAEGSVSWEPTSNKSTFQTSFPKFSARVAEVAKPESESDYDIRVYDEAGRLLERATDVEMAKAVTDLAGAKSFTMMRDLYTMARRQALGVDAALDELLSSLDEDDVKQAGSTGLLIESAKYGAGDRFVDVTALLAQSLDGDTLHVRADNDLAGDPAIGTPKQLVVSYLNNGVRATKTVGEGEVLSLP